MQLQTQKLYPIIITERKLYKLQKKNFKVKNLHLLIFNCYRLYNMKRSKGYFLIKELKNFNGIQIDTTRVFFFQT